MSTFSRDNGPGCCGPGGAEYLKIRELEKALDALTTSFNGLRKKVGNYPGDSKYNIGAYDDSGIITEYDALYAKKIVAGALEILTEKVNLTKGLSVTGGTMLDTLHVTSTSNLDGKVTASNGLDVTGATDLHGALSIGGKLTNVSGNGAQITGTTELDNLTASALTLVNILTANNSTGVEIKDAHGLTVDYNTTLKGTLSVLNGATTLRELTTNDVATLASLIVSAAAQINDTLKVVSMATFEGGIDASKASTTTTVYDLIAKDSARLASLVVDGTSIFNGMATFNTIRAKVITNPSGNLNILEYTGTPPQETIILGNNTDVLELRGSNQRPYYKWGDKDREEIALLSDLVNTIIFEGNVTYRAKTVNELSGFGANPTYYYGAQLPTSATTFHTVTVGERVLVVDDKDGPGVTVYEYELKQDGSDYKWVKDDHGVNPADDTGDHAYQWHVEWTTDPTHSEDPTLYHEVELIWAPSSDEDIKVSLINTPLVNYYTRPEIDEKGRTLGDLATRQADWLVNEHTSFSYNDKGEAIAGVDNPAYIRNKPLTGISVLDGGTWPRPPEKTDYPQFIVDGGFFDVLGTYIGEYPTNLELPKQVPVGANWVVNDYCYVVQDGSALQCTTRYKIKAISADKYIAWDMDRTVSDINGLRKDVVIVIWAGRRWDKDDPSKLTLPPAHARTRHSLKWCWDTRELFIDMDGHDDPNHEFILGNKRLNIPETSVVTDILLALGTDKDDVDQRVLSAIETIKLSKAGGNTTYNWKLLSDDKRLSFNKTGTDDNCILKLAVYLEDIFAMLATNVYEITATHTTAPTPYLEMIWRTLAYNDMHTAPSSTTMTLRLMQGYGLSITTETVGNITTETFALDDATINSLTNTPVVNSMTPAASATDGVSLRVDGDVLQDKTASTAFHKSMTIKASENLAIIPKIPQDANDLEATLDISTATVNKLKTDIITASDIASDGRITFTKNNIWEPSATPVKTSVGVDEGNGITLTLAIDANNNTTVTIALDDDVLSQQYMSNLSTGFDPDPAVGILFREDYRTIGDSTQTQKTIRLLPGANMTFVEVSGSTATNRRIQLNATMDAPSFSDLDPLQTDPIAVTGNFRYGRSGLLVNGVFTIANITTGDLSIQEGVFEDPALPVSLRPITPILFEYCDTGVTNAVSQYLKIDTDGHVYYRLGPSGSKITVPLMYFGQ